MISQWIGRRNALRRWMDGHVGRGRRDATRSLTDCATGQLDRKDSMDGLFGACRRALRVIRGLEARLVGGRQAVLEGDPLMLLLSPVTGRESGATLETIASR